MGAHASWRRLVTVGQFGTEVRLLIALRRERRCADQSFVLVDVRPKRAVASANGPASRPIGDSLLHVAVIRRRLCTMNRALYKAAKDRDSYMPNWSKTRRTNDMSLPYSTSVAEGMHASESFAWYESFLLVQSKPGHDERATWIASRSTTMIDLAGYTLSFSHTAREAL